jgi:hypothetical protein
MDPVVSDSKINKKVLIGVVLAISLLILIVLALIFFNRNTALSPSDTNPQSNNLNLPSQDSYPQGVCPDSIEYGSGLPVGTWGDKKYTVQAQDIPWLDKECKSGDSPEKVGNTIFDQKYNSATDLQIMIQ